MKEDKFIEQHSGQWQLLETTAARIEKSGLRKLGPENARIFLQSFRNTSHHLAYARTHYPDSDLTRYLNGLIGKCQTHVYAVERISPSEILRYLTRDYPRLLHAYQAFILGAFAVFLAGSVLGFVMVQFSVDNAGYFLPEGMAEAIKENEMGSGEWNYPLMSSIIMTNNIGVALKAFVLGITLGVGTLYILFYNGALLGALTAVVYLYGDPLKYWSLILPHGILELTAIFISGASGLLLARGILIPGELARRYSLIKGAQQAASLIFGVAAMLVLAGIIEGFFTPLPLDPWVKLSFAGVSAVAIGIYIFLGRTNTPKPSSDS